MARKAKVTVSEKQTTCLPKYNYGSGFGWCVKRDKKRAKSTTYKQ